MLQMIIFGVFYSLKQQKVYMSYIYRVSKKSGNSQIPRKQYALQQNDSLGSFRALTLRKEVCMTNWKICWIKEIISLGVFVG